MSYSLIKMHGCGNDFLLYDAVRGMRPNLTKMDVIYLCDRQFGVGADGLVILHRGHDALAGWVFYNSDGSEAEMCGNAARCAIKYLTDVHFPDESIISIETLAGIIKGKKLDAKNVEVTLRSEKNVEFSYEEKVIKVGEHTLRIFCINTGVPHAVIEVSDIQSYPIDEVGRLLVKHPAFGPNGTNVTFFQKALGTRIFATTFERGVERQTLACGTGAAAAALIFSEQHLLPVPIEISVPGGELVIDRSPMSHKLLLRGPAEYVMKVEVDSIPLGYKPAEFFGRRSK